MTRLLLIPICIALGFFLRTSGWVSARGASRLNRFIIYGPLPALTFFNIQGMSLDLTAIYPVASAWIIFIGAVLFLGWLGRRRQWSGETIGAIILTGGLGNTSFVGYPVIQSLYGSEGLRIAVLVDQPGSFLVLSTLGLATAALYSTQNPNVPKIKQVLKRIFSFPPIFALILAVFLRHTPIPENLLHAIKTLGGLLAPLGLISVGLQWRPIRRHHLQDAERIRALFWCLSYKLALGPAFIAILFSGFSSALRFPMDSRILQISVIESAMAPMITGGIVATEYGLDPELISLIISIGIPLSALSLSAWVFWAKTFH